MMRAVRFDPMGTRRRRRPGWLVPLLAAFVLGAAVGTGPVLATPAEASIALSRTSGQPGIHTVVYGFRFAVAEEVTVSLDSTFLEAGGTSATGSFKINVRIPRSALPGEHTITATGRTSGLTASATFTVSTDWAMFGKGPAHRRFNRYENVLSASNVSGLASLWTRAIGTAVVSSAAVVGGVVYVGSSALSGPPGNDIYALDASTGATLWKVHTGGVEYSSPAVAYGAVYVAGGYGDNRIYALDASTGAALWTLAFPFGSDSSPAVANGVVYVGAGDHQLYALDASTGATLWSFDTGTAVTHSPAVSNGVVYLSADFLNSNVYALDASTGAPLWKRKINPDSSPTVANGVVYVGSHDHRVYALDARTGATVWTALTGFYFGVFSSPAVANGVVYVGNDRVYALDASTGAVLWKTATGGPIFGSTAVANGVVYVGSLDHKFYALDASTGAILWTATTGDYIHTSPAVANGVVYVGSDDGNVYAFGLSGWSPSGWRSSAYAS